MYATLKMYAQALDIRAKYIQGGDNTYSDEILCEQAEWLNQNKKFKEAGDLYRAINKKKKAIQIYGENNLLEPLIDYCRELSNYDDHEAILLCGYYFKKNKNYAYAAEAYLKLGDNKSLVYMNVELGKWDEAFLLSNNNQSLQEYVNLKYAESLVLENKFTEAQEYYRKANKVDLSMKLLNKLIDNAIYEKRFKDVCFLFISYTKDALYIIKDYRLDIMKSSKDEYGKKKEFLECLSLSDIFNAYDYIFKYIEEPFNIDLINFSDQEFLDACLFLVNKISNFKSIIPYFKSISQSYIYYSLAQISKKFDLIKTSCDAYDKLENLMYPSEWREKLEMEILDIRSKPQIDNEIELPLCYNCLHINPLINELGDQCTLCAAPFKRCSLTFEILPLVEFRPKKGISSDLAINYIKMYSLENMQKKLISIFNQEEENNEENILNINNNDNNNNDDNLFENKLLEFTENQQKSEKYRMLVLDDKILKSLNENTEFI